MAPELIVPVASASASAIVGAITLMITGLSKQRTERIKHAQDTELERELLRSAMAAYERAAADGRAPDRVDLTLAPQGALPGGSRCSGVQTVRATLCAS